jgi:threonyl-tRNA synthetase
MLILGKREIENGVVSVRHRTDGDIGAMSIEEFTELINSQEP